MSKGSPVDFWLYCSVSNIEAGQAGKVLSEIVNVARSRNLDLEITGALMFTGTQFAQYIEGPPTALQAVRASIDADARHQAVMTIAQGQAESRRFAEWSLAFAGDAFYFNSLIGWCRERQPQTVEALLRRVLIRLAREPLTKAGFAR